MTEAKGKTILIVDDTIDLVELLATMIRSIGYTTVVAYNGEEAIEQAVRHNPDLILMDIRMPVMDGFEATERILAMPKLAGTPIVAVSAHCEGDWRKRALAAGCLNCVSKPLDFADIHELITKYIGA